MDEQREKKKFLDDEIFNLTIMATFQRSKTYRAGTKVSKKEKFKDHLRKKLDELSEQYKQEVTEDVHIRNIKKLADGLSNSDGPKLDKGRFRIGSAQKALNLFLKYRWCLGEIHMPPHCPFDNRIIGELKGCDKIKWTSLDDIEDYKKLIHATLCKADDKGIALWELATYNKIRAKEEA